MNQVTVKKETVQIPTYVPNPPIDLPMFFEKKPYQGATGRLYPLPYADGIRDEKTDRPYQLYTIENEYVRTEVLPEIGGKIRRGYDKLGQYDFIYCNEVIKPALVGLAGPWVSGGIEFNWPQHHRPTTYLPLDAAVTEGEHGEKTVWVGETEPFHHMKGMAGITICPGRSFILAKIRLFNRTPLPQIFLWWANLAAPANEHYRTVFPPDVEWVNDHDRRAVLSWPMAKGVYQTARPFDYGNGTDISRYASVQVPSSFLVSQGQSEMDFVSGYDDQLDMGFVTVADHHIAPGKKLWHWGKGDFGDMWCSNLTDRNGPYIELMTGVYSDNQPDFTWIEPYGTRAFEQYWYPIRGIGSVKNATIDAAMNFEHRDDTYFIGINVTGTFRHCTVRVSACDGRVLLEEKADLTPEIVWKRTIPEIEIDDSSLTAALYDENGHVLVSYTPVVCGQKQPISVRKPVKRPSEYETIEELYINALHLEQYKQHNYDARDYYREALRRDPANIRCNTAMARIALRNGEFDACIQYADKALERLLSRNQHPADTEALYLKGIALTYNAAYKEAYEVLHRAAWNQPYRAAAYYELALLDCRMQSWSSAFEKLQVVLSLNTNNHDARCLQAIILQKLGREAEASNEAQIVLQHDPLNMWAYTILHTSTLASDSSSQTYFVQGADRCLNIVGNYLRGGLYENALQLIDAVENDPMLSYYRAFCLTALGRTEEAIAARSQAETQSNALCFPNRLDDIAVLQQAIELAPTDANACYYLGCLYYDRFRYEEAAALWEMCIVRNPNHGKAFRNLALVYFDKRRDYAGAKMCMETALSLIPNEPRLLFEYEQLLNQMDTPPAKRLAVYEQHAELLTRRDDCWLDRITLLCMLDRTEEAIELTSNRRFHIYEGGEGMLTRQHAWMHVLHGNALYSNGKITEAEAVYRRGTVIPKSYGEAKTFFNQEAHLYYFLGELFSKQDRMNEAEQAYKTAAVYKAAISEISLFRALALRKLHRFTEAHNVLTEMLDTANHTLQNDDLYVYYGVGSPSPMPFDTDIVRRNRSNGFILKAYALLGLGHYTEAEQVLAQAKAVAPYDFRIYVFQKIANLLK